MSRTILVVEDDPKSMTLTTDILSVSGYGTLQATDGRKGVEMAKAAQPDLILMDIMMPKKDGYSACYEIKANPSTKHIPVVMLTAIDYELNQLLAKAAGAEGYVTKPFSPKVLLDTIKPLLPA